jgi:ribosomal protein S18 acetylase RimI-like enzyme
MITYSSSLDGISPDQLQGFFVGWPNPPEPETHLAILRNSGEVVLAIDDETGQVVGFINALTDRTLAAFIPLLEVLPAYQHQGIATRLVQSMLERLQDYYSVDLLCDAELQPFYTRLGMMSAGGMMLRRYVNQSGSNRSR